MVLISILQTINKIFKDKLPKETIEIIKQYYLASCYKLIINVTTTKQFLSLLVSYIDRQTSLSYVRLNDLPYYGGFCDDEQTFIGCRPKYDPMTECYMCERITFARKDPVKSRRKKRI